MWRRSPRDLRDQFCKLLESELDGTWCFAHLPRTVYLVTLVNCLNAQSIREFNNLLQPISLFPNPVAITRAEMVEARQLLERYQPLSPRDAVHAAVVHIHDMEGLVTTDRAFSRMGTLVCFDPLELYPE